MFESGRFRLIRLWGDKFETLRNCTPKNTSMLCLYLRAGFSHLPIGKLYNVVNKPELCPQRLNPLRCSNLKRHFGLRPYPALYELTGLIMNRIVEILASSLTEDELKKLTELAALPDLLTSEAVQPLIDLRLAELSELGNAVRVAPLGTNVLANIRCTQP